MSQGSAESQDGRIVRPVDISASPGPAKAPIAPSPQLAAVLEALTNPRRPLMTRIFVGLNVAVFAVGWFLAWKAHVVKPYLAQMPGQRTDQKVADIWHFLGALMPDDLVVSRQWWRLLSSAF